MKSKITGQVLPYIYILPIFLFLGFFIFRPFLFAISKSFYRYDGITLNEFIGLQNYFTLFFEDDKFWISMKNLLFFFLFGFLIAFQFPIIAAELIYNLKNNKLQYIFRSLFIIPIVVPLIVTVLVWKFMYYPSIGVFARILEAIGVDTPNFLGSTAWVKPSIIMIGFPWVAGLPFLIIFAALQGIDTGILESSRIDGCSTFRRILKIDIPLIMPQLKALLALGIIAQIQDYEKILILTQGGPNNASLVPGLHMYNLAFPSGGGESMFGYSSSMAVVLFIITLFFTIISMRINKNKD